MKATYTRARGLNIRQNPSTSAAVIGTMKQGETREVLNVTNGWCQLAGKGYIKADLVELDKTTPESEPQQATEQVMETKRQPVKEDSGELSKMTIPQLREFAKNCEIELPKSATRKADIIAAILDD